jgi:hypothetical protein
LFAKLIKIASVWLHTYADIKHKFESASGGLDPQPGQLQQWLSASQEINRRHVIEIAIWAQATSKVAKQGAGPLGRKEALQALGVRAFGQQVGEVPRRLS